MTKVIEEYVKRGNEKLPHKVLKTRAALRLKEAKYDIVLFEHNRCDITAIKRLNGVTFVIGIEAECSPKHVLNNLKRNFNNGYDFILIVTKSVLDAQTIRKKLKKNLPDSYLVKTDVKYISDTTPGYLKQLVYSLLFKYGESKF